MVVVIDIMPRNHQQYSLSSFLGLYDRGDESTIPRGHQKILENFVFDGDLLRKREGFSNAVSLSLIHI